jgi:trimethylamine---corrinoid protein Co-methyltransferase
LDRATARKEEILATPAPARFDAETDMAIRNRFRIHLA